MTTGRPSFRKACTVVVGLYLLATSACSPTLNWRENMAEGSGLFTSFPCHPDRHSRKVAVAGRSVQMEMLVCDAGGSTYAVSFFDVTEPSESTAALESLRVSMLGNLSVAEVAVASGSAANGASGPRRGEPLRISSLQIKGMTPNERAARLSVTGRRPDGSTLTVEAAFFTRGVRVYQAAVVGSRFSDDAVEPFFDGLKFPG